MHKGAFVGAETVERLGHKVVANAEAGERAFDALDDRGGIFSDAIERIADALDLLLQLLRAGEIPGAMGFAQFDVEFRKQVRAAADTAVAAELQRVEKFFLRADEQRPVGAMLLDEIGSGVMSYQIVAGKELINENH